MPRSKMVSTRGLAVNLWWEMEKEAVTLHMMLANGREADLMMSHYKPVNHFISGALVKSVVKTEGLVLQEAGEVHFLLRFMNHYHILTGNGDHI